MLEAHICVGPRRVNRLFCTYVAIFRMTARDRPGALASVLDKKPLRPFKGISH